MKAFAALLDRLVYSPGRNTKLQLMQEYFRTTPDPDRGWALAALTDGLPFSFPVRRTIMELMEKRLDAELFRLSRDYVGDTAETVALLWPDTGEQSDPPRLTEVISRLGLIDAQELGDAIASWLDGMFRPGPLSCNRAPCARLRASVLDRFRSRKPLHAAPAHIGLGAATHLGAKCVDEG